MKRRIIAGTVAAVLALLSGVLVLRYAGAADARAMAGQQPVTVVVVTQPVDAGTPVSELVGKVALRELPSSAVLPDAVRSLAEIEQLAGRQALTDLQVGEQVLTTRFVVAGSSGTSVSVPAGLQEVSIRLTVDRVVGGHVTAGSRVGVLISSKEPPTTFTTMAVTDVLVTRVDRVMADGAAEDASAAAPVGEAPVTESASFVVTLAVSAPDAEELVWGVEHGTIVLSLQNEETDHSGRRIVTRNEIRP